MQAGRSARNAPRDAATAADARGGDSRIFGREHRRLGRERGAARDRALLGIVDPKQPVDASHRHGGQLAGAPLPAAVRATT